jgi:hypothetical protein
MSGPSGPPDKFTYIATAGLTAAAVAVLLWENWEAGFRGPYVVVADVIYIGGYPG